MLTRENASVVPRNLVRDEATHTSDRIEPVTVQQIGMVSVMNGGIKLPGNEMTSLRGGTGVSSSGTGTTSFGTKSAGEKQEQ